jgi:hypothetical protein
MKGRHFLVAAITAALAVPTAATTALAAPPGNDNPSGAIVISTVPTTISQDTAEATTDALDATLNQQCGAPATNGSVWFTYTDTTGDGLLVDVSTSDFSAGAMIVEGDPTAGGFVVACGPGSTAARGAPGTTYYVMAFSDTPGVPGGNLVASFDSLPPAPISTLTVDPRATAYKDGSVRLTGTYSCSNANGFLSDIEGTVVQQVGRVKINGFFLVSPLECDGAVHSWEAFAFSDNGLFAGGKAANVSVIFACGDFDCGVSFVEQRVQISRNGK